MCLHNHRVLVESGITPGEWAILSAASYFSSLPPTQLVIEAQLESEDEFSTDELKLAGVNCGRRGWIIQDDNGIVLTEEGRQLKERVNQELMETVELL